VRAILDSNVWLAILTTNGSCRRLWKEIRRDWVICASQKILEEIEGKLRLKFGFSPRHARLMTLFVERQTIAIKIVSSVHVCRDADDDFILAAAIDGHCSHLVTGDSDLLTLKKFEGVCIVAPREFMEFIAR
jgi:putative PIN family toxin of toxin-antitoxin system